MLSEDKQKDIVQDELNRWKEQLEREISEAEVNIGTHEEEFLRMSVKYKILNAAGLAKGREDLQQIESRLSKIRVEIDRAKQNHVSISVFNGKLLFLIKSELGLPSS
jgi:hypothetical protein